MIYNPERLPHVGKSFGVIKLPKIKKNSCASFFIHILTLSGVKNSVSLSIDLENLFINCNLYSQLNSQTAQYILSRLAIILF